MSRIHWVLALVLATGCATAPPPKPVSPPIPAPGTEELWAIYAAAVRTAQYPVQDHVSTELVPILRTNPELRWDQQGRVLMVTWTKKKYYDGKIGQAYTLPEKPNPVTVWLTAVPYLQEDCRGWNLPPQDLPLRTAQVLGTPPPAEGGNDSFVQMWVDPRTFFRPCPDPEITDRECQVSLDGRAVDRSGGCPWSKDQLSGAFVRVSDEHIDWMCANWEGTYKGTNKFPWTALGYTFDWGDLLHPQGQSEYVAPPGTTVWIESISSMEEYCESGTQTP
ncbi:MAG TPA: hypothetical protein VF179_13405 [Thermoanaerobaculia bacterium]|nr:hypothetical protein [Thermoanaerobaculia bacterium]